MERKGFTLVELLVVAAIVAILVGILVPTLSRARDAAQRSACSYNLSCIGRAMMLYGHDNDKKFPRAGGAECGWSDEGYMEDFDRKRRRWGESEDVTVTASLYLLVKYADAVPSRFVCGGDDGATAFKVSEIEDFEGKTGKKDVWDFGGGSGESIIFPGEHCSYAYHMPYNFREGYADSNSSALVGYALSLESDPESPVCADRNPYLDKNAKSYIDGVGRLEEAPSWSGEGKSGRYEDPDRTGNSALHKREGQNVLFVGGHVKFAKYPNVGIYNDNIWKHWEDANVPASACDRELGPVPYGRRLYKNGQGGPGGVKDAYLVGEANWRPVLDVHSSSNPRAIRD
ncbi:MAG: type II secretion system protein [Planctomycetota bacterium]